MTEKRLIDVDITDRANGKLPVWDSTAGTHVYADPASSGVPAGTSFPGSPATNDLYFRTDRGIIYFYDGTRWVSIELYAQEFGMGSATFPVSTTVAVGRMAVWSNDYDIYMVDFRWTSFVSTTNSGSAYWNLALDKIASPNSGTNIATPTTASDSANAYTSHKTAIGALLGTTSMIIGATASKTGSPGNLTAWAGMLTYRLVG